MTRRVTPTFLLKGLDPNKLLTDYQSGFFIRPPKISSKIVIAKSTAILPPTYGTSNHDPIYCVKDKNNCRVVIATTGHANFEVFTRTGGQLPIGGRCDYCKEDFTQVAIGYPIGYQEQTILTNDSGDESRYRIIYNFWTEGELCSFECALTEVRRMLSKSSEYRDTTIRDSERMLRMLYKFMHPNGGVRRPAQDYKLLRSRLNTCSLMKEEWKDPKHLYVRTDRVLMIPAKVEYIQQNFLNQATTIEYPRDMTIMSS